MYSSITFAQNAWTHYSVSNSPLPENSIRCIAIDRLGHKWIGTDYGLSVYDDTTWINYFTSNSGLPDNGVRAIAFDSLQNAWIGTFNGGLAKFDGANWTVYNISNSLLPDNFVRALDFDSAGALWIATLGGLAKFDGTNWITYTSANTILTYDNIAAVHSVRNNRVFAGTVNGGLAVVDNDTIKDVFTIANGSGIPDNTQVGFDEDSLGNVWIATPSNGIVVRRIVGGWFWYYLGNSFIPTNSLTAVKFNSDESSLWMSTLDSGMVKKTGVNYQSFTTVNSPMPDNSVQCFTLDSNDVIWIGTASQGVVRFDESITGINYINPLSSQIIIYPNPSKNTLYVKSNKNILRYCIYNNEGMALRNAASVSNELSLDVSEIVTGIYLMQLFLADGDIAIKKFVKQ